MCSILQLNQDISVKRLIERRTSKPDLCRAKAGGSPAPGRASHEEPAADQPFSVAGNIMKPDLKRPKERAPPVHIGRGMGFLLVHSDGLRSNAHRAHNNTNHILFGPIHIQYRPENAGRATPHSARPSFFAKAMADRCRLNLPCVCLHRLSPQDVAHLRLC
jgi:hypothetical protein